MKKNYISPNTIEVKIRGSHLLAVSDPHVTINAEQFVDPNLVESRRSSSIWEDEDEDYYE